MVCGCRMAMRNFGSELRGGWARAADIQCRWRRGQESSDGGSITRVNEVGDGINKSDFAWVGVDGVRDGGAAGCRLSADDFENRTRRKSSAAGETRHDGGRSLRGRRRTQTSSSACWPTMQLAGSKVITLKVAGVRRWIKETNISEILIDKINGKIPVTVEVEKSWTPVRKSKKTYIMLK